MEANNIIDKYGLNEKFDESCYFPHVEPFLASKGWIKYSTNGIYPHWCFTSRTHLTQAQIDKIYELTGEVFEDKNLLGPCLCAVIFFNIKKTDTIGVVSVM